MTTQREATGNWHRAFALVELEVGGGRVFREDHHHVAVFRVAADELYAVDNRCPHEGYPLAKGYVTDCVVTCPWHNFKFDLRDGACVMGDEAVRTFPLRIRRGQVEVDLAEPDPDEERARLLASLEAGMSERKLGQCARDVVRLLRLGILASDIAFEAVRFDSDRAPFGSTHVLPLATDVIAMTRRFAGVNAVLPLMQVFDQASDSHVRRAPRPTAEAIDPGDDPVAAGDQLAMLVEEERVTEAEALLRGALGRAWGRSVVEPWLFRLCAAHFLDFGHALIYQIKGFDLLEEVGWGRAADVLPAHLVGIVNGTREDMLPEWQRFADGTAALFADRHEIYRAHAARPLEGEELSELLICGDRLDMLAALDATLRAGTRLEDVVNALSLVAAERLLRFDETIDADPAIQESWLGATHLVTYVNALRYAVQRFEHPDIIKLIAYGARIVNNAASTDAPPERRVPRIRASTPSTVEDIISAIAAGQPADAVARVTRYLEDGGAVRTLHAGLEDVALDDAATRPIVVLHLLKTTRAACDEVAHHRDPLPLIAVVRWLASPVRERPVGRIAHEAIRFVVHGKVPRTLT